MITAPQTELNMRGHCQIYWKVGNNFDKIEEYDA